MSVVTGCSSSTGAELSLLQSASVPLYSITSIQHSYTEPFVHGMVPAPVKQKALALKKQPRNRTWECVYEIYSHLQKKNRVLKSGTEKANYFKTLLEDFSVKGPNVDPDLGRVMEYLTGIVHSHVFCLLDPNIVNTAEENGAKDDDDDGHNNDYDDDDVIVDPQYKYFLDHLRPDGKYYILDIPEDGVFEKYEFESTPICTTNNANHVSNEEVNVNPRANCKSSNVISKHVKRRGRKAKGAAKLSAAMNGNVKNNDVAPKSENHESNLRVKRRSNRLQRYAMKTTMESEDSDVEVEEITRSGRTQIVEVEHCYQEDNDERRLFKENLMEELKAPYCEEEHKRLLHDITVQKQVQHHRELRGGIKIYDKQHLGKSFLAYYVDLQEMIKTAGDDHPRVLNLLRGFFYWLKNLSHYGAFKPWQDPSCLDVLPQQQLDG